MKFLKKGTVDFKDNWDTKYLIFSIFLWVVMYLLLVVVIKFVDGGA